MLTTPFLLYYCTGKTKASIMVAPAWKDHWEGGFFMKVGSYQFFDKIETSKKLPSPPQILLRLIEVAILYHHQSVDEIQDAHPLVKLIYAANILCPEQDMEKGKSR